MTLKEKIKFRRFERFWKKQGRKDLFTWVHRYLRLHRELLSDSVYQNLYDYCRNTLIAYLKKDTENKKINYAQLGELVDVLADIFNKDATELVNKYKSVVDELYRFWKENPNAIYKIHI